MSFGRSQMTMRAVLRRNTASDDSWASPGKPGWDTLDAAQACYIWIKNKRHIADGIKVAVVEEVSGIFPPGTDVACGDRLDEIKDRNGKETLDGVFNIEAVSQRTRGARVVILEALLRRVS